MNKKLLSVTGLALGVALFLAFNILATATFKSARIDLTENRLYTLSPGTIGVLSKLKEEITLRLFFSRKLAAEATGLTSYAQRVQELLEQYVSHSGGKITLEVIDPEPYTETEERAVGYGLQGVPATLGGEMLYFGLVGTGSTDLEEVIPFIQENKEESLEYEVTRLVHNLDNPKKKIVGLLSTLPVDGDPMARMMNPRAEVRPWFLMDAIRQTFEVQSVPTTTDRIDPEIDVLMLVHPQDLGQETLFAIDQYVLGGGKVLAFLDPHCEAQEVRQDPQNPMAAMMANRSSTLAPLLSAWGLELSVEDIAGDRESAMRVGYNNLPVDFVLYLQLRGERRGLSKDDFVTSKIEVLQLAYAGILKKVEGATTTVTPLIETGPQSMAVSRASVMFGPDPQKLLESFVPGDAPLLLAARLRGSARTAFPEGRPPKDPADGEPAEDQPAPLKESLEPINVIVVADTDMLADNFWTRTQNFFGQRLAVPTANNADFVVNALDNLCGSDDLISLRSRGRYTRPFERVAEIRRESDRQFGQKVQEFEDKLRDTQTRIDEIEAQKGVQSAVILSAEKQAEKDRLLEEKVRIGRELRQIKRERNREIEALGTNLKFVNILLIPLLVILAALAVWMARLQRARAALQRVGSRS